MDVVLISLKADCPFVWAWAWARGVDGIYVLELGDVAVVNDANLLTAFSEIE